VLSRICLSGRDDVCLTGDGNGGASLLEATTLVFCDWTHPTLKITIAALLTTKNDQSAFGG